MIDLHTHLLPGIDDGVKSLDEAVKIIKSGVSMGVTAICLTPHLLSNFRGCNPGAIMETYSMLQNKIIQEEIDVHLYLGSEIDLRDDLNPLREFSFFFINQTKKYLLLELPLGEIPAFTEKIIFSLIVENLYPILAHPERSLTKDKDFERIEKMARSGALIQLNAGSITGDFGKKVQKVSEKLLEKDIVDFVASDTHNLNSRPIIVMAEAFRIIERLLGEQKAMKLFKENPQKVLQAENIQRKIPLKYS
ncbi:MAG: hypothetical protein OEV55_04325 [candidate division Zixibacteria bacterium]|nr:hypothetical protein [candidate division Zixibacteria bacterium]